MEYNFLLNSSRFNHYISLGYFCSIAMQLEKYGFRDASYPFDWLISDFRSVISTIDNGFKSFLCYENLYQNENNRAVYLDKKYEFLFVHDFSKYLSLSGQLPKVQEKYNRRIQRFYNNITEPTLFIRYISDEDKDNNGKSSELQWIEDNIETILSVLKKYNPQNEIIWIANEGVKSEYLDIYNVFPDDDDNCCRKPFESNELLKNYFESVEFLGKDKNIERYNEKLKKKMNYWMRAYKVVCDKIEKTIYNEYYHEKTYS